MWLKFSNLGGFMESKFIVLYTIKWNIILCRNLTCKWWLDAFNFLQILARSALFFNSNQQCFWYNHSSNLYTVYFFLNCFRKIIWFWQDDYGNIYICKIIYRIFFSIQIPGSVLMITAHFYACSVAFIKSEYNHWRVPKN